MALAVPPDDGESPLSPRLTRIPSRRNRLTTPHLSVVIVNYCQWVNTNRLVRQLRRSDAAREGTAEIVVIDNHSAQHPAERALRRRRGLAIHRSSRNLGFARAVNRGASCCSGKWVLLLNPDVTVEDGFLDCAIEAAQRLATTVASAGVIGFQLRNRDGSRQASSGPFPTLRNTLEGLLRSRAHRKCQPVSANVRREVPWVTGGCLLVRRDCFRQLGGFDERFFLYYEDVDFCLRARSAGWTVWYEPELAVTHHWPLHSRAVPAPLRLITRHALLTYAGTYWPRWQATMLGGLVWVDALFREFVARLASDVDVAACYRELRGLVGDVLHERTGAARRRVRRAADLLEAVAAAQDQCGA